MTTDASAQDTADRFDAARIAAEIVDTGAHTDPFVAVVRATRMPIVITDPRRPDNPVVFANDSFCALTGYARDEVVGRNWRFLDGPATDATTIGAIATAVADEGPLTIDVLSYRKNGVAFWNRLLMGPVLDASGSLAYYFASMVDVSDERDRLAALKTDNAALLIQSADRLDALRASEARLRFATEAAAVGVWEITLPDLVLTATPTLNAVYGLPPGPTPPYATVRGLAHPDDAARVLAAFNNAIAGHADYNIVYRINRPDGRLGWVEVRGRLDREPDGSPTRIIGASQDVTVRRDAEIQLELNEESLRLATGASGVGTWDLDLTTDILTWSPLTKGLFGISPDAPCSMADFANGLHPDDAAATLAAFEAAVDPAVRAAYDVEYRTIGKEDGVLRWVAARGRALFAGDQCLRAIGTAIDLGERRAAAERLRANEVRLAESEAFATLLLEATSEAFYSIDTEGVTTSCNRAFVAMLGFDSAAAAIGRKLHDVIHHSHPDGRPYPVGDCPIYRAAATGQPAHVVNEVLHRLDGTVVPVEYRAEPVDRDGVRVGAICTITDVTARRAADARRDAAEAALRELNATLEARVAEATLERDAIWRESRDLLLVVTPDGIIEAVNPAWTETLGYTREELIGHRYSEFVVADDVPASDVALGTIPIEPLRNFENRYRHADGSIHDFAWTAAAANGRLYCIARDITAEKAAARALETAQDALRQAQKMEAVGQLTGGIAHDFNNMLAVVLGSLDLLGRRLGDGDPRLRRYADAALDGARRAATLTQRLLAFSRQQPLQPEPVDVNRLVAGMSDLLRGSLGGGVQLETVLAGGLWPVNADPNQLENIILNLGINARDAMAGEGRVTIETANTHLDDRYVAAEIGLAAGQYVLIAVTDAGAGMPPEVIAKAFDPFFTTKGVGKGTGLGLSQVYGFVKQSGGHVKIYSEVGVGTTVKLYLPRLTGAAVTADSSATGAIVGGDGRETILVVEDEPGVRAVSVEALRDLGYRVIEADGAAAALRLLEAHDVDLLFSDIVMPEMNGARLADAARALRPGLKVLFTTGYTKNAVVHNGVVDAGVELIGKPFTIDALAAKVRSVLDG